MTAVKIAVLFMLTAAALLYSCYGNEIKNGFSAKPSENYDDGRYLAAVKLGGEWFQNNRNGNFLYYGYLPFEKRHTDESHPLREMGAMWSLAKLAYFLNDSGHKRLAEKGFSHFEQFFVYDEANDFYYVNITEDIKLGYSAFVVLTLLEIEHPKKALYLDKFAKGIMHQQQGDGSLSPFFFSNQSSGIDYYPGEALLALMYLYEHDMNDAYLGAVERAFPYYLEYWKDNPNEAFAPWQTQAYYKLYEFKPDARIAEFIFGMNDFMIKKHSFGLGCNWIFFYKGIVAAVYIEGMNSAYQLAKETGDMKRAYCYKNFIRKGSEYILRLQFTQENNFGIRDFGKASVGGFLENKYSGSMRVDRNQHAVMALMKAYELGILTDS